MPIELRLDAESPVPLYHQIAEAIRYRVATGRLAPGEGLPPVRQAAEDWGVNMHTVRQAYRRLADDGLVEIRGPLGTRVVEAPPAPEAERGGDLDRFLSRTVDEARRRFGLGPRELARWVGDWVPAAPPAAGAGEASPASVSVVECSEAQCAAHAAEIEAAWRVEAWPWCLDRAGEPPPGEVVATWFHYNEIRRRWPHRLGAVRFVAIHPDPRLAERVRPEAADGEPARLLLCELDEPAAANIAADLSLLFPPERYAIEPRVVAEPGAALAEASAERPVLLTPRVWGRLSAAEREAPHCHLVPYVVRGDDLAALGPHFGWRRPGGAASR
ncbi:MAG TPA: GntR family transcriptional regulator [Thermoanaerobaculia bacterium]|nr:GntR family transcriptional regulator [Thermoanaerobaculia bacterium]